MYLIEVRAPLISLETVEAALNIDQKTISARVQDGVLEYAFDIRGPRARNACLRVFAGSLAVAQGRAKAAQWPDFDTVVRQIVPVSHDPTAAVVARRFNCVSAHIYHLLDRGLLRLGAGGVRRGKGPKGSQRICHRSLVEFLAARRVL